MSSETAEARKRRQWADAQKRRRALVKDNRALFRLALNPDLIAEALIVAHRAEGDRLLEHPACEQVLADWITELAQRVIHDFHSRAEPAKYHRIESPMRIK